VENNLRHHLGEEIADLRVALFVRCLRREICGELLEARIIPERIERRIEPEQRRSERRTLSEKFGLLFRRERGDDFLKARIAAERVPDRV
jgi:hypothetical protein